MKGMQMAKNPANFNKYQFLNRETQFETGYIDLIRRQYDPQIGRFISQDPVTDGQEHLSLYQYGWNNPILKPDPNGDFPIVVPIIVAIAEAITAAVTTEAVVAVGAGAVAVGATKTMSKSGTFPGGEHQYANWAKALDPSKSNSSNSSSNSKSQSSSTSASSKNPPNPNGKNGGKLHQEVNKKEADRMKREGKEVEKEVMVKTPDGKKSKRFIDQTGTDPKTGEKEMVQVGKQNKNGTPVKRERDAMDDIEKATGQRPKFVPYNPQ
jgi:RHS repeat-associated protein